MARPWRIQYPGAIYHVMARGNNRKNIFITDSDRRDLLGLLDRFTSRYRIDLFAFCLMPNHYHLFLRTNDANLSPAMQWLNGTYTTRFNARNRTSGHLFGGRYKTVLLADQAHWLHLSAYIHLNPLRAGLCQDPAKFEWSSFRDYTRSSCRFAWLKPNAVLENYGPDPAAQRRNYRRQVLALAGKEPAFWDNLRAAAFLGPSEQWDKLKQKHPPAGRSESAVEYNLRPMRQVDFEEELARVAQVFGVSVEQIKSGCRKGYARSAVYYHLVEHCCLSGSRVAELLDVSGMSVSLGLKRIAEKVRDDHVLRGRLEELKFKI